MTNHPPTIRSFTETTTTVWISLSAFFSLGSVVLSSLGQLDRTGCGMLLLVGLPSAANAYHRLNGRSWKPRGVRFTRFRKPFPLLYTLCALAAWVGGTLHEPSNHDALGYRIPRLLHWLAENHWHWIGGADTRMDFAAFGSEAHILPAFATFHTLRLAFLMNAVAYLLMPGLVFSVFRSIGIRKSAAATWMWILPCASCYATQAGSIGNDLISCIFLLAALMFAFRGHDGHAGSIALAILSASLMTGVKATNLPLLLPIAICLAPAFLRFPKKSLVTAIIAGGVSLFVSYLPTAVANTIHTGNWTGETDSVLRIKEPMAGVAGNSLLIGSACLAPAVFPPADRINQWFNSRVDKPPLGWIKRSFVDFRMTHPQLAAEEHSGLGLGVFGALVIGVAGGWRSVRLRRLRGLGGWVAGGFLIATLFYMIKLGNCGAPRYFASYYPGLIVLPLLLLGTAEIYRKRWWRWCSLALLLPILPALAASPARPLLPMGMITDYLSKKNVAPGVTGRMRTVYEVYARRHDVYARVREMLPPDARKIAFAGTSGESEYSFWLPLGSRRVNDFGKCMEGRMPDPSGYDAIVASDLGTEDRFGMTPEELAEYLGWKIVGTTSVRALASKEPANWSVLVPARDASAEGKRP